MVAPEDVYRYQEQLFDLIDGCRMRGVLHLTLHDGTAFSLDPSYNARQEPAESPAPPPIFAPEPERLPHMRSGGTLDRTDSITAELDAALFGKSLDDPTVQ